MGGLSRRAYILNKIRQEDSKPIVVVDAGAMLFLHPSISPTQMDAKKVQANGLIEAMVCGKQVVYAFWGDVREKWADNVIPFHKSKGLYVAESKEKFKSLIMKALSSDRIPEAQIKNRKPFIEEYFNQCDGHSSARTLERINDILETRH